ncbi:MAG TPA: DUF3025 domain-containing protein [Rudaea sp.]|jgi:hypothetical protein|uniref:DUF3025 domain-containing protein n=1 Tax=Rudaea sp. TaxID=2136325 RepID=UPI002F950668
MRFIAPAREAVDPAVFARLPLSYWSEFAALLGAQEWPSVADLDALRDKVQNETKDTLPHFVAQSPQLLGDGLHYEARIAERGIVATRERNWHDLLNALIWLRYPALKSALNARQVAEIALIGAKQRTRAQYALTHFDEGGAIVQLRDPALLELWDAHDWHGLFWRERAVWRDGSIAVHVFGHALLEHALNPNALFVGKALVVAMRDPANDSLADIAAAIRAGDLLNDPQELRPLPLSGIPGWHADNEREAFYADTPCFRPLREGRRYPPLGYSARIGPS